MFQIDRPCFRLTGSKGLVAIVPVDQEILDTATFDDVWKTIFGLAAEAAGEQAGRVVSPSEFTTVQRSAHAVFEEKAA